IFALGTAMRFWELSSVSLWRDEAVTLGFARLDKWTILSKNIDNHPPLAWVIQHIWHGINPDPAAARVPAATAGSLAVLLFMLALRDLSGERTALFGGLLLAFSTSHIHYSQDARMYPFLVLGLILAAWGAIGHAQPGKLRPRTYAALYVLGGAIAIYSHLMGLVAMAVIGFASLASGAQGEGSRPFIRDWFVRNIILFVVVLPWLVLIPSAMSTFPGLADVSPALAHWYYRNVAGFPGLTAIGAPFELLLLAAAGLSIPVAWFARQRALAIFFLGMIIVYPLIITLLHLRPGQPILSNRAMMPILVGVPFGAAYAFAMLKPRIAGTVLALIVSAAALAS
ncbi:MAG: glycosyltransferase family 39 protein, partial [Hyphomonas sp.]|nr:glycosyltransferase family 39 protein [Hyphomonas sp.]